jgi:hypothetical protein
MASTDATPVAIKNQAFRWSGDLRLNTGALNSGAAGLDSEISKDGGTMTDCTNEATEIAASSGHYFLDLTATEMNADCVVVQIKSSTTNAVTRTIVIYPQEAGNIPVDLQSISGNTSAVSNMQLAALAMLQVTVASSIGTISASSIPVTGINVAAPDYYKDRLLALTSGSLIQQIARITAYAQTGAGATFTVTGYTSAPANGVTALVI